MNRYITLDDLITVMSYKDNVTYQSFEELIDIQSHIFQEHFEFYQPVDDTVELWFNETSDKELFVKHFAHESFMIQPHAIFDEVIYLKPIQDVRELLLPAGPLRVLAKEKALSFALHYQQSFTNTRLQLKIEQGKLVGSWCKISLNQQFPYLTLGLLAKIMKTKMEFKQYLTQIQLI